MFEFYFIALRGDEVETPGKKTGKTIKIIEPYGNDGFYAVPSLQVVPATRSAHTLTAIFPRRPVDDQSRVPQSFFVPDFDWPWRIRLSSADERWADASPEWRAFHSGLVKKTAATVCVSRRLGASLEYRPAGISADQ